MRRDVAVAGTVLGLLAVSLFCYLIFSSSDSEEKGEPTQEISAASWLGYGDGEVGAETGAPAAVQTEPKYAPTPEELQPPAPGNGETGDGPGSKEGNVRYGSVQKGTPVINSLVRLGLTMGQAHGLITALKGVFDFRKARPGQAFQVHVDPATGEPSFFRYEVSLVEVYEVTRNGREFKGYRKQISTDKKQRRYGGTISSSLYRALQELSAHPTLTGRIVEVLSNQVDFYTAQRPGDTFRVIVEEESLHGEFLGYGPVQALEYDGVKSGKRRFYLFAQDRETPTYYDDRGVSVPGQPSAFPCTTVVSALLLGCAITRCSRESNSTTGWISPHHPGRRCGPALRGR